MKNITKYYLEIKIAYLRTAAFVVLLALLFFPSFHKIEETGDNMYTVLLNGETVGTVESRQTAETYLRQARANLTKESNGLVFVDADLQTEGKEVMVGKVDSRTDVVENMCRVLRENEITDRSLAYTIKINEFTVNIQTADEVIEILQAALNKYDADNEFQVELVLDPDREINVLTTKITTSEDREKEVLEMPMAGVEKEFYEIDKNSNASIQMSFDDFDYGLVDLYYGDAIEVIETYLPSSEMTSAETAKEILTKDQEKNTVYEVQAGDTLSEISLTTEIPLDRIIEMNETLEDENSVIRAGDELIITIPEPELSVGRQEEIYYEEDYDLPTEYIYNDDWYTTDSVVRQQPSAGHRKVAAVVTYRNNSVTDTEILKEEVTIMPVAKVVEVGTKIPPTYIKPISGGRQSSGFGKRSAPTKGASTYHKGIDWATPVGTSVVASCAGTVVKAGWGSGYGYVVYIDHPDGRQTRYGHLSKVLVKVGQTVSQGQKIALSGNTGRSTGPHLHFEILIGGSQVNPLQYLN
jgi:murein DD-endopeptidase MepM/ murein hydrolase activator NlpD